MAGPKLLKAELYQAEGTQSLPSAPSLKGGKCSCGAVFFPMQTYGCEYCGKDGAALKPTTISGKGTLVSSATVHLHAARNAPPGVKLLSAPFTIGVIKLDDGPTIRTLVTGAKDHQLVPGTPMLATFESVGSDDPSLVDLRFSPAS